MHALSGSTIHSATLAIILSLSVHTMWFCEWKRFKVWDVIFFLSSWLILIWVYGISDQIHSSLCVCMCVWVALSLLTPLPHSRTTCRVSAGHEITIILHETTNHNDNDDNDEGDNDASRVFDLYLYLTVDVDVDLRLPPIEEMWGKCSLKVRPVCEKWHVWQ